MILKRFLENIRIIKNQIILIYPYPEISFDITKKIQQAYFLENVKIDDLIDKNTF